MHHRTWVTWQIYLFNCFQSSLKKTTPVDVTARLSVAPAEFLAVWNVAPYISRLSTICISRYSAVTFDTPVNPASSAVMSEMSSESACLCELTGSQSLYNSWRPATLYTNTTTAVTCTTLKTKRKHSTYSLNSHLWAGLETDIEQIIIL